MNAAKCERTSEIGCDFGVKMGGRPHFHTKITAKERGTPLSFTIGGVIFYGGGESVFPQKTPPNSAGPLGPRARGPQKLMKGGFLGVVFRGVTDNDPLAEPL